VPRAGELITKEESGIRWMTGLWFPVHLGFCPDRESFERYTAKVGVTPAHQRCPTNDDRREGHFSSFEDNSHHPAYDPFGLITISKRFDTVEDPNEVLGVILHESVHAFDYVLERMDERRPSSEFHAYGIQAIFVFMLAQYSETRKWKPYGEDKKAKDPGSAARSVGARNRKRVPRSR
jgi:hypothetical protein